jgi:membrane protease YdiL (CAAX protease family)
MFVVWTILMSGARLAPRIGAERATLLVFSLAGALLVATRGHLAASPRWRDVIHLTLAIALGFAAHPVLCGAIGLAGLALGLAPLPPSLPGHLGIPLLLAVVIAAPCFEELLYRERLLDAMAATRLGKTGATLVSSALFASSHLAPWQMLGSFVVGLLLASTRIASGSLTPCIGIHVGLNLRSVWAALESTWHA